MIIPQRDRVRMRDSDGLYSMVAVDQRDSLRAMLAGAGKHPVTDERMQDFKVEVARALSPVASALLVDTSYALQPILDADALAEGCDLIVALDEITYDEAGVAQATSINDSLMGQTWDARVAGFKYLLLWTPGQWLGCDRSDVETFVSESQRAGVASILEVIVREEDGSTPTPQRQAEMVVNAARETADLGASLYKAEVPFRGQAAAETVTAVSAQISEVVTCPWVILSGGVPVDEFPDAVEATARGGAEGFLAGRAVWSKATALDAEDSRNYLRRESVATMAGLRRRLVQGRTSS